MTESTQVIGAFVDEAQFARAQAGEWMPGPAAPAPTEGYVKMRGLPFTATKQVTQGTIGIVQGTCSIVQGTFGIIQGTFGIVQGTYGIIQGTLSIVRLPLCRGNEKEGVRESDFYWTPSDLILSLRS
jgi:hypothetical protein